MAAATITLMTSVTRVMDRASGTWLAGARSNSAVGLPMKRAAAMPV